MKILLDTNVILDIVLERHPFDESAIALLQAIYHNDDVLFVTATTITDLYYVTRKAKGHTIALNFIVDLLEFVNVAGVDEEVITRALHSQIIDFEDAIQESAAKIQEIDVIVTRNVTDFVNSEVEIHTPDSFLKMYKQM
ncbi:MAG: PIN domain-containing protein [Anaerolineae bacterium]